VASFRTIRRSMKIWQQVAEAMYPFDDTSPVVFNAKGKIVPPGKEVILDIEGKVRAYKRRKESFYGATLRKLQPAMIRRFVYFCKSGPEPTDKEFKKFRLQLVGHARQSLLREQMQRVKELPHLPGRGRLGINDKERSEIRKEFESLKHNEAIGTATAAVEVLAEKRGFTERNIWKILSRTSRK
jgi:hypothetical protein